MCSISEYFLSSPAIDANKAYIEKEIPPISSLLKENIEEVMDSEIIIINHNIDVDRYIRPNHSIVDLRLVI